MPGITAAPGTASRLVLPDFPWDTLREVTARARAHPDGIVDLSVGTPVDPTPAVVQAALTAAADAPGYPATAGTPAFREAVAGWFARTLGVRDLDPAAVLPSIGSKELVAWLPTLLGLPAGSRVLHPDLAYPTYDVGARIAGCEPVPVGPDPSGWPEEGVGLVWLNSPANPTGRVADAAELASAVAWARAHGVPVASDECYIELAWDAEPVSVLHGSVSGRSHDGVLCVHSLSKRSNFAGYRAGVVAGDPALVARLLEVRKHAGMMVPDPVQAAAAAAYADDEHVVTQRERYRARRDRLRPALAAAGFRIDHSAGGLYLWAAHPDHDARGSLELLAGLGILVAPGTFYGAAGGRHVRVALTATDERIDAAVARLEA